MLLKYNFILNFRYTVQGCLEWHDMAGIEGELTYEKVKKVVLMTGRYPQVQRCFLKTKPLLLRKAFFHSSRQNQQAHSQLDGVLIG